MGTRTGAISFGGLASGIPTSDIIEQLMTLERRPIDLLEGRKSTFESQLKILQDLSAKTLAFRDALRLLDNMNLLGTDLSADEEFSRFDASSSDATVATASATSRALQSSLTVEVTALAFSSRHVTDAASSYSNLTDTVDDGSGSHTFSIEVGATQGSGTVTNITIDSSNNTVESLVAAINSSGAAVRAFVIDDGSASANLRIGIQGTSTGDDSDVFITHDLSGGSSTPVFLETQDAQNAALTLDPGGNTVSLTSSTNTFANVIEGITVVAKKVDATAVTIEIEPDQDALVEAITGIVSAYNEIVAIIEAQSVIDATTNRGGPLIGDSTLQNLKSGLATIITSQIGSGTITSATQLGIKFDSSGQLSLDEDVLRASVTSDLAGVKEYFAGSGSLSDLLRDKADRFVDPVDGSLVTRISGTTSSISDLVESIRKAEDRLETVEASLVRQFAALERIVSGLQAQGNFIAQFLLAGVSR